MLQAVESPVAPWCDAFPSKSCTGLDCDSQWSCDQEQSNSLGSEMCVSLSDVELCKLWTLIERVFCWLAQQTLVTECVAGMTDVESSSVSLRLVLPLLRLGFLVALSWSGWNGRNEWSGRSRCSGAQGISPDSEK